MVEIIIPIIELTGAIFIAIALISQFLEKAKLKSFNVLRIVSIITICYLIIDAWSYLFEFSALPVWIRNFVNYLAYSFGNVVIIFFLWFLKEFLTEKIKINHWFFYGPIILSGLCVVATSIEYFLGRIVSFETGSLVVVGDLPIYIRVAQLVVMAYMFIFTIVKRKTIGTKGVYLLLIISLSPIIAAVIAVITGFDLTAVFGGIGMLIVQTFLYLDKTRSELEDINLKLAIANDDLKKQGNIEYQLQHERLRKDILEYMVSRDDDPIELLKMFAERIRVLIDCDQVIYRDLEETRIMVNSPAIAKTWSVPIEYCKQCEHFDANHPMYRNGYTEMDNCQEGWEGIPVYHKCPIKSSLTRLVYCDGEIAGYLAIHYVENYHNFVDTERTTLEEFTRILSMSLSRYKARKENKELKLIAKMKKELEEALDMAQEANKAKTDFLFSMSHDIRTPLNAIMGFTGIAKKHIDDKEKVSDCLDKALQSGSLLTSLINSVLEVSRIESGHAKLIESVGKVHNCFRDIQDTLIDLASSKDIDLKFEIGNIKNDYVYVDFERCDRIFINIISNAIKYTNEGGKVRVKCEQIPSTKVDYGNYKFTFTDNGIGMSEEFQKHVFDHFAREETTTVSRIQGSGLGMTIAKSFVDLMGGTIECHSELGKGTTFIVVLPLRLQEGRKYVDPVTGEEVEGQEEPKVEEEKMSFKGKKCLLVEDNELNREIAEEILKDADLIVETAEDGRDAVETVKAKGPKYFDFILMDIQMPIMNGYEATRAIRRMYPGIYIPIIAVSANAFDEDKKASIDAGMDGHIAKPINVKELLETIAKFIR